MYLTRKFKAWLFGLPAPQKEKEEAQEPFSESHGFPVRGTREEGNLAPQGTEVSHYSADINVGQVVFNTNRSFVTRKDSITKKVKRVPKKDIGSISKVLYYDDRGRLLE